MTRDEVVRMLSSIEVIGNIRDNDVAYLYSKNKQKLEFGKKQILKDALKLCGEKPVDEWLKTNEGIQFANEDFEIKLHKLKKMPEVQLTGNEMIVLSKMTDGEDGTPDGPPVKK